MARTKMVNGEVIALTAEEETARDAQEAQAAIEKAAYDNDYSRKRREAYNAAGCTIEECIHAILDDGLVALQEKRAAVKARYPK